MSQVGLKELHIAVLTDDDDETLAYDSPDHVAGAITATINPNVNTQELYADDQLWESVSALGAIEVEIEVAELSLAMRGTLSGHTVAADELVETADTMPPHVALGFASQKANGEWRHVWLLKGVPQPVGDDYASKTDSIDHKTPRIRFTFMPRIHDQEWRHMKDAAELDETWFASVPTA